MSIRSAALVEKQQLEREHERQLNAPAQTASIRATGTNSRTQKISPNTAQQKRRLFLGSADNKWSQVSQQEDRGQDGRDHQGDPTRGAGRQQTYQLRTNQNTDVKYTISDQCGVRTVAGTKMSRE